MKNNVFMKIIIIINSKETNVEIIEIKNGIQKDYIIIIIK